MTGNIQWDKVDQKVSQPQAAPVAQPAQQYAAPAPAPKPQPYQYKAPEFAISKKMVLILFMIGAVIVWISTMTMILATRADDGETVRNLLDLSVIVKSTGGLFVFAAGILGITSVPDMEKFTKLGLTVMAIIGLFMISGGLLGPLTSLLFGTTF